MTAEAGDKVTVASITLRKTIPNLPYGYNLKVVQMHGVLLSKYNCNNFCGIKKKTFGW